jgi:hypothetical protein
MLLESAANRRIPVIELTIDELRKVLSVPEGKLSRWVDLNRFAIDPAICSEPQSSALGIAFIGRSCPKSLPLV